MRATVAQIEVANLVGNTVDGMLARLTRKRPLAPIAFAREVYDAAWALLTISFRPRPDERGY